MASGPHQICTNSCQQTQSPPIGRLYLPAMGLRGCCPKSGRLVRCCGLGADTGGGSGRGVALRTQLIRQAKAYG
jgi:hypothetical protein